MSPVMLLRNYIWNDIAVDGNTANDRLITEALTSVRSFYALELDRRGAHVQQSWVARTRTDAEHALAWRRVAVEVMQHNERRCIVDRAGELTELFSEQASAYLYARVIADRVNDIDPAYDYEVRMLLRQLRDEHADARRTGIMASIRRMITVIDARHKAKR